MEKNKEIIKGEIIKEEITEVILKPLNGVVVLFGGISLAIGCVISFFTLGYINILAILYLIVVFPLLMSSFVGVNDNEAVVLTLFGKYYGTIKEAGFHSVNPFASIFNPTKSIIATSNAIASATNNSEGVIKIDSSKGKRISLKINSLDNGVQKVNDSMGNPIEIGVMVVWRVVSPTKAVFEVDNYFDYLSNQADIALRNIVRQYPYDLVTSDDDAITLRGDSAEVGEELCRELQEKMGVAGIEIMEVKITRLSYAQEIAAAMLQRQQASAIIDAKKLIVEGAVGMVKMALEQLDEENIVTLDDERKATMVSNLLVVLCGNKDPQPVVNSGSIY